jgi:hypothetical protein
VTVQDVVRLFRAELDAGIGIERMSRPRSLQGMMFQAQELSGKMTFQFEQRFTILGPLNLVELDIAALSPHQKKRVEFKVKAAMVYFEDGETEEKRWLLVLGDGVYWETS